MPGATPLDPLKSGEGNHGKATVGRRGAAGAHLSACAYLRRRGLGQRVRFTAERRLGAAELRELNRIGVNLNQMARAMNTGAGASAGTREAVERVGELVARLLAGETE